MIIYRINVSFIQTLTRTKSSGKICLKNPQNIDFILQVNDIFTNPIDIDDGQQLMFELRHCW
jgi:hypothetical protein